MKTLNCFIKLIFLTPFIYLNALNAQHLVSVNYQGYRTGQQIKDVLISAGLDVKNKVFNDVVFYKVIYITADVKGNETRASGAIYLPFTDSCNYFPIISYDHGTIFDKTDVPSNGSTNGIGFGYAGLGYLVSIPDYLGLGENAGIHPYLHAQSEATASLDLIRALKELTTIDSIKAKENNQLFLCGYSQGGHAAMATHQYIQDNNLENEFNVVGSAPLSGAYDLLHTQMDFIIDEDSTYYAAEFIPYILGSYQLVYGNIYESYAALYDQPYDSLFEAYLTENHTALEWRNNTPDNFYEFLQDSVLENIKLDTGKNKHPIHLALKANDVYNWKPEAPVRMFYCGKDSMVTPANALLAEKEMKLLGAKDVKSAEISSNGDHNSCYFPALFSALNWFDTLKETCKPIGIETHSDALDVKIFQDFNNHLVNIVSQQNVRFNLKIFDVAGNLILTEKINKSELSIDISDFSQGVYLLKLNSENQKFNISKKIIKF